MRRRTPTRFPLAAAGALAGSSSAAFVRSSWSALALRIERLPGGRPDRRSRPEDRGSERNLGAFRGATLVPLATPSGMRTSRTAADFRGFWYARRDSNARPSAPEACGRVLGCRARPDWKIAGAGGFARTGADKIDCAGARGAFLATGIARKVGEGSRREDRPQTATRPFASRSSVAVALQAWPLIRPTCWSRAHGGASRSACSPRLPRAPG